MDTDAWFAALALALRDVAPDSADGATATALTDAERDGLLDLARVAAHTAERWTAPVSTFLAGVALASLPAVERADAIRAVVGTLETRDAPS